MICCLCYEEGRHLTLENEAHKHGKTHPNTEKTRSLTNVIPRMPTSAQQIEIYDRVFQLRVKMCSLKKKKKPFISLLIFPPAFI